MLRLRLVGDEWFEDPDGDLLSLTQA